MPFKKLSQKYKTPKQVQIFIKSLEYNREKKKKTLRSAREALRAKTAHCLEAAFIAAAILEHHGYPPHVISLESQDGLDHVIYVFQRNGRWGSIGGSRDEGLHGRPPIYRSLRDLAWSYFDPYVDRTGRILAYQIAHLDDTKANWRTSPRNVWKAENYLLKIKHIKLKASASRYRKILRNFLRRGPMPLQRHWW
jgi:hypothetical protein